MKKKPLTREKITNKVKTLTKTQQQRHHEHNVAHHGMFIQSFKPFFSTLKFLDLKYLFPKCFSERGVKNGEAREDVAV